MAAYRLFGHKNRAKAGRDSNSVHNTTVLSPPPKLAGSSAR